MRFETAFICEREHLVIDTSGVPDAQDVNASIYQFLRDAVYGGIRSEEHTTELQSPVPNSYAVFCLKKKKK